jgi:hypothetical protein
VVTLLPEAPFRHSKNAQKTLKKCGKEVRLRIDFTLQEKDLQQLLPGVKIPPSSTESSSGDIKLSGRPTQSSFVLFP